MVLAIFGALYVFYRSMRVGVRQSEEIKARFVKDSAFVLDDLTDLPLLKFENDTSKKDYFVILFAGDGGWRGFINVCAKTISGKGVDVVGFNTLPYFDTIRTPRNIARDVGRVVHNFGHAWKKKFFILGGYSFSAEILPFVYNNLSPEIKEKVYKIFMIAPSTLADFKASRTYIYDKSKSIPVLPELEKADQNKFIIFCDDADESLCKILPSDSQVELIHLDAGHLFLGKFRDVSSIIADKIVK